MRFAGNVHAIQRRVVSVATHLVWLVVASIVGFCNISVVGVVCFHFSPGKLFFHSMCLRDCSAEATRGFAMVAMGLFHVEVMMS